MIVNYLINQLLRKNTYISGNNYKGVILLSSLSSPIFPYKYIALVQFITSISMRIHITKIRSKFIKILSLILLIISLNNSACINLVTKAKVFKQLLRNLDKHACCIPLMDKFSDEMFQFLSSNCWLLVQNRIGQNIQCGFYLV